MSEVDLDEVYDRLMRAYHQFVSQTNIKPEMCLVSHEFQGALNKAILLEVGMGMNSSDLSFPFTFVMANIEEDFQFVCTLGELP